MNIYKEINWIVRKKVAPGRNDIRMSNKVLKKFYSVFNTMTFTESIEKAINRGLV